MQVALKTGNTAIASYLLDMGADVNFIEDETCCNAWRTPVLHDAINCAVMSCRWNKTEENTAGGPCGAYIGLAGKFEAELSNTQRHTEANTSIFSRLRQHLNEP